jgi:hypothetical protein
MVRACVRLSYFSIFVVSHWRHLGPNHKGQLCVECDLEICKHAGKYLTQQHWSCCGHKRHEPCICPAVPAPPQSKDDSAPQQAELDKEKAFLKQVTFDLARLIVSPDTCRFPGTTFEEMKQTFLEVTANSVCFCNLFSCICMLLHDFLLLFLKSPDLETIFCRTLRFNKI